MVQGVMQDQETARYVLEESGFPEEVKNEWPLRLSKRWPDIWEEVDRGIRFPAEK